MICSSYVTTRSPSFVPGSRRGILLNEERCRRVTAKQGQKAVSDAAFTHEFAHGIGKFVQSAALSANRENRTGLAKHAMRLACAEASFQLPQKQSAREDAGAS